MIPTVNFHLWEPCNMRCHFCFATFKDVKNTILPKGHLPKTQALEVVNELSKKGFEKITFVGGEPTLCPWLSELISAAKYAGMTTMIVTNGSNLTDEFLRKNVGFLDWITLSIDSIDEKTNIATGRAVNGKKVIAESTYFELAEKIKKFGYNLKVNTVVTRKNFDEKLITFITKLNPARWKIFQVLPIIGQNDLKIVDLLINRNEFQIFLNNNFDPEQKIKIVSEENVQMKGSYVMVDPAGRFFTNSSGKHIYSDAILEVGCDAAFAQMDYDEIKFIERGGIYNWTEKQKNGYQSPSTSYYGQIDFHRKHR